MIKFYFRLVAISIILFACITSTTLQQLNEPAKPISPKNISDDQKNILDENQNAQKNLNIYNSKDELKSENQKLNDDILIPSNKEAQIKSYISEKYNLSDFYIDGNLVIDKKTKNLYILKQQFPPGARDSHGHKPLDHALTVLAILFFTMIIAQIILKQQQNKYYRSYRLITSIGLQILPFYIGLNNYSLRFLSIQIVFSFISFFVIFKAFRKPLEKKGPRNVYSWFYWVYIICYIALWTGFIGFVLDATTLSLYTDIRLTKFSILTMFYGIYFGVLGRDCAEICSDKIASIKGFVLRGQNRLPSSMCSQPNICAICNDLLILPNSFKNEKTFKLNCSHQFHDFCIRGQTMIGKKDTCPCCSEKVDLRNTFQNPQDKHSILQGKFLNLVRYLVVWNPLILWFIKFLLQISGYGSDDRMPTPLPVLFPLMDPNIMPGNDMANNGVNPEVDRLLN